MKHDGRRQAVAASFLGLAVAGAVLSLAAFLPWFVENGPDVSLLVQELFRSRVSAFFAWDVIVSAVVVLVATNALPGLSPAQRGAVAACTLLIGPSCGLPLLLAFWMRNNAFR